ncbi:MAG: aminotransferase class V-fold PLP-dependent enzyme [Chloroflexota bacterium]
MLDIIRYRAETPGVRYVTHFNNAGSSLPPAKVLHTMIDHLEDEAFKGGYEAAKDASDKLDNTYQAVAKLINAETDEIAILENATRAWTMAFYGIKFADGDRILTSVAEYASNYIAFLQMQKHVAIEIDVVPNDEHGQLDVDALRDMMDERVRLIAISHVPTQNGLVQPATEIGRIAAEYDALYLLDACQSVGQMPIDVEAIGCHMLSATGRKYLRGPRGIGFLYVKRDIIPQLEPPVLDLHSATWQSATEYTLAPDATRFENWEMNIAAKIGLGVAVDYALSVGIEAIQERVTQLADTMRQKLADIDRVTVHDVGVNQCGIVTFSVEGMSAEDVSAELRATYNINTSVSPRTYAILDFSRRNLDSVVRSSVHYYNTDAEIDQLCEALVKIMKSDS